MELGAAEDAQLHRSPEGEELSRRRRGIGISRRGRQDEDDVFGALLQHVGRVVLLVEKYAWALRDEAVGQAADIEDAQVGAFVANDAGIHQGNSITRLGG